MGAPATIIDPLTGRPVTVHPSSSPGRDLVRDVNFTGAAPDMGDPMGSAFDAFLKGRQCPPNWWFHDRQEFRMSTGAVETIATFKVTVPGLVQPGFFLRIQNAWDQALNNVLTTVGAQAPAITYRVRVRDQVLERRFTQSPKDGAWWIPYCVQTDDEIEVTATPTASILGHFANGLVMRTACEISIGAELPDEVPVDGRRSMRTINVTLAAPPLVPTLLIGPASVLVATFPNSPLLIVPNSLVVAVVAGAPTVFVHGVSTTGVIDPTGEPIVPGLVPNWVYPADGLQKVALSKPGAGAATVSFRWAIFD